MPLDVHDDPGLKSLDILHGVFGYDRFRPGQEDVIRHVMRGQDALVLMPTGGGKSLCYQIPALMLPGVTIVVSPLVALMRDQVLALRRRGVAAAALTGEMPVTERAAAMEQARNGALKLLYVSPERLATDDFQGFLKRIRLSLFAIDEAHCVSQWGHGFREDYLQVGEISRSFGVPRLAVTATASPATRHDILNQLGMQDARVFSAGFERAHIHLQLERRVDAPSQLVAFLHKHRGESGIIYCRRREETEEVAALLRAKGFQAIAYHAGLNAETRRARQESFMGEPGMIVAATVAFGMGIDKPDVRFVAHLAAPDSLESYYQETGRAGRDGLPAVAWMCYDGNDIRQSWQFISKDETLSDEGRVLAVQRLQGMAALLESPECRDVVMLRYFGSMDPAPCGHCDRCRHSVATIDGNFHAGKVITVIEQTGQRYGAGYVTDVLCGIRSDAVLERRHDKSPCFGIGQGLPARVWKSIIRQMFAAGLLDMLPDKNGGLSVADAGKDVARGERAFRLVDEELRPRNKAEIAPAPASITLAEDAPPERVALYRELERLRDELTARSAYDPRTVLPNQLLVAITETMPASMEELRSVPGMTEHRLGAYGGPILDLVGRFRPPPPELAGRIALNGF